MVRRAHPRCSRCHPTTLQESHGHTPPRQSLLPPRQALHERCEGQQHRLRAKASESSTHASLLPSPHCFGNTQWALMSDFATAPAHLYLTTALNQRHFSPTSQE